ncbi:unnamed protein product [Phytophthora lilii]|uniref:Unnamed protein product n=1 Tax=Phytophthora lilii TaxID=2077276 RepID=A0A9W6XAK5_9STRA|nr:unnamed protein product [Phytophthora lilii]
MTRDEQMDAASLVAMAEFLRECEAPVGAPLEASGSMRNDLPRAAHLSGVSETADQLDGSADDGPTGDQTAPDSSTEGQTEAERRRKRKNEQAAERRVRYLKKLKVERKTLKMQEVELTHKLQKLRQTHAKENSARNKKMVALSAWKATALRQKERRETSEQKQRQLKMAVINQSALIHRMNHLLQQRRLLHSEEPYQAETSNRDRKGKALLGAFVQEMDSLYAKTDDVIGKVEFEMSPPLTYELTRKWSKDKSFLESADATVIPFSFDQTCRAVSLMILAPSYNDELGDPENTAVRTYRLNFSRELGSSAHLVIYNAVKRYVDTDRAVFVWRALAEGQGEFDGLHTVETAWFIVRPFTKATTVKARECNKMVLESYTRLVPVGFGRPSENDTRANKFIKILAKADEADVSDMKQMLGKLLFDNVYTPNDGCSGRRIATGCPTRRNAWTT